MRIKNEVILAIDASLSSTGYAVFDKKGTPINVSRIVTTVKEKEDARIKKIVDNLISVALIYNVNKVIIEDQFVMKNKRTAMQLSRLRGAISYAFNAKEIEVNYITPTAVKKLMTGKGNASKLEIYKSVISNMSQTLINKLSLGEFSDKQGKKKTSDMYDAIAIGYSYIRNKA